MLEEMSLSEMSRRQLTTVDAVHCGKEYEQRLELESLVDAPQTQAHVHADGHHVLAKVGEMWERVASVLVTSKTLQRAPNPR